ncbi:MAG TPA: hypothetical protein VD790_07070 [Thermoleophilaceae bacterium]|nr:hypothetical protein [Thermoleophilaceae bacterium]
MNAFHVLGGIAAIWAVLVAIVGIKKEDFPGGAEKIVAAISVIVVAAAISSAIITSANEEEEHGGGAVEATSEHE